eukprot:3937912-Rhodomonas_salina.2
MAQQETKLDTFSTGLQAMTRTLHELDTSFIQLQATNTAIKTAIETMHDAFYKSQQDIIVKIDLGFELIRTSVEKRQTSPRIKRIIQEIHKYKKQNYNFKSCSPNSRTRTSTSHKRKKTSSIRS